MRRFLSAALVAVLALAALPVILPVETAYANNIRMCGPIRSGAAIGPRQVTATSGTVYNLDARGCARVAAADLGYFVAQGFIVDAAFGAVVTTGISSSSSGNTLILPASAYIAAITVQETSGGSFAGNLEIGTSNGGTEICCVAAQGITANSVWTLSDAQLKRRHGSVSTPTTLYVDSSGSFSTSALTVTIVYGYY